MKLNLLSKMGLIFTVLLIVNISVVMFSISTLSKQESDGVVINIAGRQRMLSQKMSKESFLVASGNDDLRSTLEETKNLFDTSLNGLIYGNPSLGLPPTKDKETLTQMKHVESLWERFKPNIETVISNDVGSTNFNGAQKYIKANNVGLLKEMNKAVGLYESVAKGKINFLKRVFLLSIFLNILVITIALYILFKIIVKPIISVKDVSGSVAEGDLRQRVTFTSDDEIGVLAGSFNIMIENLSTVIAQVQGAAGQVGAMSQELAASSEEMNATTEQVSSTVTTIASQSQDQAKQVESASGEMKSLSAMVHQVSEGAQKAAEMSGQAYQLSHCACL